LQLSGNRQDHAEYGKRAARVPNPTFGMPGTNFGFDPDTGSFEIPVRLSDLKLVADPVAANETNFKSTRLVERI
jgi:hypothetical protein